MNKEFTYSFIIPHKNCPDLLQRCVDSIPERDDVEIIVVDDNSTEGKKPSLKEHKNLQVILLDAERSKGAGRARNVGLEHAKGKWLLFADADDYYNENELKKILNKYLKDESTDLVYLNACVFDEEGNTSPYKTEVLFSNYSKGIFGAEGHLRYSLWTPWSRMVKRSLVESYNIRFDELPACNDKMFCLYCSRYAKQIFVENSVVYNYYKPKRGSITDKQRNNLMLDGLLDVRGKTIELYEEVGYCPIPAFFELAFFSKYSKGLNLSVSFAKYRAILNKYNQSMIKDLLRYLKISIKKI